MFKKIMEKVMAYVLQQIENSNLVKTVQAQTAASKIKFTFEEFCTEVQNCLEEQSDWTCRIERQGHIMTADEVREGLSKKAGIFRHIPWVAKKIDKIATECDGCPSQMFFAETCSTEHGGEDVVKVYYDVFSENWWNINLESRDWRSAIREIIRHEYRHVAQIKELRRRGGSKYVSNAFNAHMRVSLFTYKKDPMEADAYANQKYAPADQSDISCAVDKIIANF